MRRILFFSLILPIVVHAQSIDHNCEPNGLISKGSEAWNPNKFWNTQLKEIQEYVKYSKQNYQVSILDRKRDAINEKFDDEEMRLLGIEQYSAPVLDREMAQLDKEMIQFDKEILNDAISWGKKCTAHARRKLSILK